MFKLALSPKFWAQVDTVLPGEDGGTQRATFDVQYLRLSTDQIEKLRERILSERLEDRAVAREIMVGFRRIADDDGNPLDYSEAARERLLDAGFSSPIVQTFFQNVPRARQKN